MTVTELIHPCLVSFVAQPRPESQVLYIAPELELSEDAARERFAWVIEPQKSDGAESKIFYAERYGGIGMGPHGGGARCGYDGEKFQLKGIGPNPLVGLIDADSLKQSNGELALASALYEMVWSRILQQCLPYGVNVCLAVLALPDSVISGQSRALLVRELLIRPAHFERAAAFRHPRPSPIAERSQDVQRVAAMCDHLAPILQATYHLDTVEAAQVVPAGLCQFACRQAHQLAFAQSHFLYHSLSSSNFSVDGKWLDFTATSPLNPAGIFSAQGMDSAWLSLWDQDSIIVDVLYSLVMHYSKYQHLSDATKQHWIEQIITTFKDELHQASALYLLQMAGVPAPIANKIAAEAVSIDWAHALIEVLKILPVYLYTDEQELISLVDLTFSATARADWPKSFVQQETVQRYLQFRVQVWQLILMTAQALDISEHHLRIGMTLSAIKRTQKPDYFSYHGMMNKIETTLKQHEDYATDRWQLFTHSLRQCCDALVESGVFYMTYEACLDMVCWQEDGYRLIYHIEHDDFSIEDDKQRVSVSRSQLKKMINLYPFLNSCLDFYRHHRAEQYMNEEGR